MLRTSSTYAPAMSRSSREFDTRASPIATPMIAAPIAAQIEMRIVVHKPIRIRLGFHASAAAS